MDYRMPLYMQLKEIIINVLRMVNIFLVKKSSVKERWQIPMVRIE